MITSKRVDAGIPFCFTKSRIVKHENNTLQYREGHPLTPADDSGAWGEGFQLAAWMEHMLGDEQLKYERLAHAYKNAYVGQPKRGHAHFLVGPPNCGKTLYNSVILGGFLVVGSKPQII